MISSLLEYDQWLFELINYHGHNDFLDFLMPYWREKVFWVPAYIALFVFMVYRFKIKAIYFGLAIAVTIGIADTVSSQWIKKSVQRIRPCNDPLQQEEVKLLVRCGGGYSFTSSHATNHFAIALFIIGTLGLVFPKIKYWLLFWAGSIAYGQVYVGVHYPFDVLVGGMIGSFIGYVVARLYNFAPQFRLSSPKIGA